VNREQSVNKPRHATLYCIDGSGNQDQKAADRKRPIYRLDVNGGAVSRPLLEGGESAFQFFVRQIADDCLPKPVLIAADLPIGLSAQPSDVCEAVGARTFLEWLVATQDRLAAHRQTWREGLIAAGVSRRTALRPFVSIGEGDQIARVRAMRVCDVATGAESVYCVDHGGKQVGRAALQFWFEVLQPLREQFKGRVAVWPFEPWEGADIVFAECYPAECQRIVYGATIKKRQPLEVAKALTGLLQAPARSRNIPAETWVHAASSEDEFDMFTAAFALRELLGNGENIFWHPPDPACTTLEGWILGLHRTVRLGERPRKKPQPARDRARARGSLAVPIGGRNRHDQEDLGPSGNLGAKGPLHRLKCRRRGVDGAECGHEYETNAQDVFQKKCPVCPRRA
jgi:hypothetical protein